MNQQQRQSLAHRFLYIALLVMFLCWAQQSSLVNHCPLNNTSAAHQHADAGSSTAAAADCELTKQLLQNSQVDIDHIALVLIFIWLLTKVIVSSVAALPQPLRWPPPPLYLKNCVFRE